MLLPYGCLQLIWQQVGQATPGRNLCCPVQVLPAQLLPAVKSPLVLLLMILLPHSLHNTTGMADPAVIHNGSAVCKAGTGRLTAAGFAVVCAVWVVLRLLTFYLAAYQCRMQLPAGQLKPLGLVRYMCCWLTQRGHGHPPSATARKSPAAPAEPNKWGWVGLATCATDIQASFDQQAPGFRTWLHNA